MLPTERRYDIDWLRVIAIALLLVYHIAIAFQPWGVFIGFIQNAESLDSLWVPMSMLNIWRIPLLFAVSGMGVSFALRKRNWKQLILERTRRILLPFLPALARLDVGAPLDACGLPPEMQRAVIAYQGQLTPGYEYLAEFLD